MNQDYTEEDEKDECNVGRIPKKSDIFLTRIFI